MGAGEQVAGSNNQSRWEDFQFRRVSISDYPKILEHHLSSHFMRDEPTCELLGWNEEFVECLTQLVRLQLDDGLSFVAEYIPTGEIASVWVISNHTPNNTCHCHHDKLPVPSMNAKLFVKYAEDAEALAQIERKQGVSAWAELYMASTSPKFRNKGLATELCSRALDFLKNQGFKHVLILGTSPYTRRLASKFQFCPLARLAHADFLGFDGQPMFKTEHFGVVMLKAL